MLAIKDITDRVSSYNSIIGSLQSALQGSAGDEIFEILATAIPQLFEADALFQRYVDKNILLAQGSARTKPGTPTWKICHEFARIMVEKHSWVYETGGGPGTMAAGNEGAGVKNSLGLGIELPFEAGFNETLTGTDQAIEFKHFFARKLMMMRYAKAVAVFDTGFGTLDEVFETIALIQTGKSPIIPIVFIHSPEAKKINGKTIIETLDEFNRTTAEFGTTSHSDMDLYRIFDDPEKAAQHIVDFYSNFHSIKRDRLDVRINTRTKLQLSWCKQAESYFEDLVDGQISSTTANPDSGLYSIEFKMRSYNYGRLRKLIDFVNYC